uniref:F4 family fimbrial subunit n=1 Tax=Escherichia coli TaxID=562 RepID=UPI001FCE6438
YLVAVFIQLMFIGNLSMKKTLIALAVAASAVVSGSAMAWTANGTGNSVELGGTLTPVEKITPWEVKTGAAVTGLDADVTQGQSIVNIALRADVPVLGIRNNSSNGFLGQSGIDPQISYGGKVDIDSMNNGAANLALDVTSAGQKIGTLSAEMWVASQANNGENTNAMLYAPTAGDGFFGGVAKNEAGIWNNANAYAWAVTVFPGIAETWSDNNISYNGQAGVFNFDSGRHIYHAYYASGIDKSKTITITLDTGVAGDSRIQWNASLPVTVSYM